MKARYTVVLIKNPVPYNYPPDYFPRKFAYRREADMLVAEVGRNGGKAEVRNSLGALLIADKR
jgi:hypothetical protein